MAGMTLVAALQAHAATPQTLQIPAPLAPGERVGLVLGGGGARGFAHLGVLEELERLRVPISCIAGSSAGALVGGMYANGMSTAQMRQAFSKADWESLLSGATSRPTVPFDRKRDDYRNFFNLSFGVGDKGLQFPRSAINSQEIELFIRALTRDRTVESFDQLPIPFRAVATDFVTGEAVVFDQGNLAQALRASMAVPGVFDWVEDGDRLLVDGGLARNLPISDIKGKCADRVIVVDVGSPLLNKKQMNTVFDVLNQTTNLMVHANVRTELEKVDGNDVVIRPELDGIRSTAFQDNAQIIEAGRKAVAPLAEKLRPFAVSPEAYASWHARLVMADEPRIDEVRIKNTRYVNSDALAQRLGTGKVEAPLSADEVREQLRVLFAEGDYDRLTYNLDTHGGRTVLEVMPFERSIGPNYLRFGLNLKSSSPGDSSFSMLASHQRTWLNSAGGVWRNELQIGANTRLKTELYQPWSAFSPAFGSLSALYESKDVPVFGSDHKRLATVQTRERSVHADVGVALGPWGEMRAGVFHALTSAQTEVGAPSLLGEDNARLEDTGLRAGLVIDQFDNPRWPRNGYLLNTEFRSSIGRWGSNDDSHALTLEGEWAATRNDVTYRLAGRYRGYFNSQHKENRYQSLGGFLNLSGYQTGELVGERAALLRLMSYWRVATLPPALGTGLYVGASAEVGRIWNGWRDLTDERWLPAGSLFVGADTLLGPFFVGVGHARGGRLTGYMLLGLDY